MPGKQVMAASDPRPLRDRFLNLLAKEMKLRKYRGLDEWIEAERLVMLQAVNAERARLRKPDTDMYNILQVENSCVGHVDYAEKYALRCAELALYK